MFHSFQKNVLTSSDCSQLIILANSIGFTPSTVNIHGQLKSVPSIRNNERIEFQNSTLASQLLPYVLSNLYFNLFIYFIYSIIIFN